jgi:hypothetical protein
MDLEKEVLILMMDACFTRGGGWPAAEKILRAEYGPSDEELRKNFDKLQSLSKLLKQVYATRREMAALGLIEPDEPLPLF